MARIGAGDSSSSTERTRARARQRNIDRLQRRQSQRSTSSPANNNDSGDEFLSDFGENVGESVGETSIEGAKDAKEKQVMFTRGVKAGGLSIGNIGTGPIKRQGETNTERNNRLKDELRNVGLQDDFETVREDTSPGNIRDEINDRTPDLPSTPDVPSVPSTPDVDLTKWVIILGALIGVVVVGGGDE